MNTSSSAKLYKWEGNTYLIDLSAPADSRIMVEEDGKFISKPGLGILATTIEVEGELVNDKNLGDKSSSAKLYSWEGKTYLIDLSAPAGSRVLVKEDGKFVSKPDIGRLGADIEVNGELISDSD